MADSFTVSRSPSLKMFADLTFTICNVEENTKQQSTGMVFPASFWGAGCSKNLCWEFFIRWRSSLSCSTKVACNSMRSCTNSAMLNDTFVNISQEGTCAQECHITPLQCFNSIGTNLHAAIRVDNLLSNMLKPWSAAKRSAYIQRKSICSPLLLPIRYLQSLRVLRVW